MPDATVPMRRDWLDDPATVRLIAVMTCDGAQPDALRFVGGSIRDALLGRQVADVDAATPLSPDAVTARLVAAGIRVVPTGIAHGTVTAVIDGRPFEITTLRRDVETDGRHARVVFTDDWVEDAARRDFTINAMSLDVTECLHDPFGGQADLAAGRVRFVGQAHERIAEDVLRLLRFFRFHAWYGRGEPDAEGLAASVAAAPALSRLSAERVRAELLKLLSAPDPMDSQRAIARHDVLAAVVPDRLDIAAAGHLVALEAAFDERPGPLRRLAALVPVEQARATELAARLRMSRVESRRLSDLARPLPPLGETGPQMRAALYRIGAADLYRDLALVTAAEAGSAAGDPLLTARLAAADAWNRPKLPIGGRDAVAAGIPRGESVGRVLAAIEDWWIESDFGPDRTACLARLAETARLEAKP